MADDRGRPLHRVDLGDQRHVDQPRPLVDLLLGPLRVLGAQPVADGVVLQGEQGLHQQQAEPEAGHQAGIDGRVVRHRRQPVRADVQFAVLAGADQLLLLRCRAIDLRCVPPGRLGVRVGWRMVAAGRGGGIGAGPHHLHRPDRPRVIIGERNLPGVVLGARPVAEPVTDHELQPRRDERVDRGRRDELRAGEQRAAHLARAWLHHPRQRLRLGVLQWHVPAEPRPGHPHPGLAEVVVGAVESPVGANLGSGWRHWRQIHRGQRARVVEVAAPEHVAEPAEHREPQRQRKPVPADLAVSELGGLVIERPQR